MSKNYLRLSVAHLCPNFLGSDVGNILAFKKRCEWRNIDVEIAQVEGRTRLGHKKYDFIFTGSGQLAQMKMASECLYDYKEQLQNAKEVHTPMLSVGFGYYLFGNYYQPLEGEILAGVGLLDIMTNEVEQRFVGNALGQAKFLEPKTVTGFENKNCITRLNEGCEAFMNITRGYGNNGEDKTEGAKDGSVFGTSLHGPILPQNPHFCDHLIMLALNKKYGEKYSLEGLDDDIENHTHHERVLAKY